MSKTVAETILQQLGGNKFQAMTGSRCVGYDAKSLTIRLAKNMSKANHLKITLTGLDLHDVEFFFQKLKPSINDLIKHGPKATGMAEMQTHSICTLTENEKWISFGWSFFLRLCRRHRHNSI